MDNNDFFTANWNAPNNIGTLLTYRTGGVSEGVYASLNVGTHVNDNPQHVAENRKRVQQHIPHPIVWLNQIHSANVIIANEWTNQIADADAAIDTSGSVACAVMTADCLPILLCDKQGSVVAAVHGGWRSLLNGILVNTINKMKANPQDILAYLGVGIGKTAFEVGSEVKELFIQSLPENQNAFVYHQENKYLANIYQIATNYLKKIGVNQIFCEQRCTFNEKDKFFSYRRDRVTGRMVSAIWLK